MGDPRGKYGLDPTFEAAVLAMCASSPRFWGRIGHALDAECMELPIARAVIEAVRAIARDVGHGPDQSYVVTQRMHRRVQEGRLTLEDARAAAAALDDALDRGLPDEEATVIELAPLVRRRLESAAIVEATELFARQGDLATVADKLTRAKRVGAADVVTLGSRLAGGDGFAAIERAGMLERLATGVLELDMHLDDGLARGQLGVVMGGPGDGKSIFLGHQAAEAVRRGINTAYATLELPKPVVLARLYAALTGVPTNHVIANPIDRAEARRRMKVMTPGLGACLVEEFAPQATTVADLRDWIRRCEEDIGAPLGCVVVDYADMLHEPKVKNGNTYEEMRQVYQGLRRDVAVANSCWVWTASQANRSTKDQEKRLDLRHAADSLHKVRIADIVLTLNAREDGRQMVFYVAKNRTGKSRMSIGPVPTDFERGRIVPLAAEWADWSKV